LPWRIVDGSLANGAISANDETKRGGSVDAHWCLRVLPFVAHQWACEGAARSALCNERSAGRL